MDRQDDRSRNPVHDRNPSRGSSELALAFYLFLAAFAYLFASLGGAA